MNRPDKRRDLGGLRAQWLATLGLVLVAACQTYRVEPDGAAPRRCDAQYGGAPAYLLCEELETTCDFSALASGMSCRDVCGAAGGDCLDAWDSSAATPCVIEAHVSCDAPLNTRVCRCTRTAP